MCNIEQFQSIGVNIISMTRSWLGRGLRGGVVEASRLPTWTMSHKRNNRSLNLRLPLNILIKFSILKWSLYFCHRLWHSKGGVKKLYRHRSFDLYRWVRELAGATIVSLTRKILPHKNNKSIDWRTHLAIGLILKALHTFGNYSRCKPPKSTW